MMPSLTTVRARHALISLGILTLAATSGCTRFDETRTMEATAYCGCGDCCDWRRGSAKFLYLDFWNRYVDSGSRAGQPYTGKTASGTHPNPPQPGLVSLDSLTHPWRILYRVVMPWLWLPEKGTIAADTDYYPFGTVMYVPGWGWGEVEDRGGAIKGPNRIDLFHQFHFQAMDWGRQQVEVKIQRE